MDINLADLLSGRMQRVKSMKELFLGTFFADDELDIIDQNLGKTHLMHSIGRFILEQNPDMKVLYVTSEVFTNEVIDVY